MAKDAVSVSEFCAQHNLSRGTFYKLAREGRAPALMQISDRRVAVSREAAEQWRREREADAVARRANTTSTTE